MLESSISYTFLLRSDFVSKKITLNVFLRHEICPDCYMVCRVPMAYSMCISRCRYICTLSNWQTTSYYLCFCLWEWERASSTLTRASQCSWFLISTLTIITNYLRSSSFTNPYFWQNSTSFSDSLYESIRLLQSYLIWLMVLLIFMIYSGESANFY